ncbi:MAG: hotdog fold thioesterase [Kangiellaceae bacterium]|jgi:uncharacterized protein (TIGR00369 family)|nr:hotdog fold thioesterase [Kangiellaceae bacterium]
MAKIWQKEFTQESIEARNSNTLATHLDMRIEEIGDDFLTISMPVDETTHQPMGLLHGGASVALAETVGSIASNVAAPDGYFCVGMEINANHVKAIRSGRVFGTARPIHLGKTSHVWEIKITNNQQQLICISRLTMAVRKA